MCLLLPANVVPVEAHLPKPVQDLAVSVHCIQAAVSLALELEKQFINIFLKIQFVLEVMRFSRYFGIFIFKLNYPCS